MQDLTQGHEGKQIFYFALPMLIGSLFQQLYNITDSIIVGRYVGTDAMAAVSGASPIMFLLVSLLTGITLGFSILLSQYYGAKDMDKVKKTLDTSLIFIFVGSLLMSIIGVFFSKSLLEMMNTPDSVIDGAANYLIIIFAGLLFSAGYNAICAILRGLGDSKNPLIFLIIATIINIILDIVFVIYMDMGVEGVALATIIAQAVAFAFSVVYLNRKHTILKIKLKHLQFDTPIFLSGLRLGLPSAIQQVLFSMGNVALQSLVNSFGAATMAAFGAGMKIEGLISLPVMNLGAAISTFVAQNMGAGKLDRIKRGVRASIRMSISLAVFVLILFFTASEQLIGLFSTEADVIEIGSHYLIIIGCGFVAIATSFMWTSAIRGAGDAVFAMVSSIISLWLARIPTAYVLSSFWGTDGIWLGIPIGWAVGFVVVCIYYRTGHWQNKAVVASSLTD